MFSKTCEYAIRACIFIATQSSKNNRITIKDISENIGSPKHFTAKILQILAKKDLVISIKGIGGGFEIPKENLKKINLAQIVIAIDGDSVFRNCGLGLKHCTDEHPCPLNKRFNSIREDLNEMLENTYLEELVNDLKLGDSFLI